MGLVTVSKAGLKNTKRSITPREIEAGIKSLPTKKSLGPWVQHRILPGLHRRVSTNIPKLLHKIETQETLPSTFLQGHNYPDV